MFDEDPSLLESVDKDGRNALHFAAGSGNPAAIEKVLELNPSLLESVDGEGNNALHFAAGSGNPAAIEKVLELKPSLLRSVTKEGTNAWHFAKESGNKKACIPFWLVDAENALNHQLTAYLSLPTLDNTYFDKKLKNARTADQRLFDDYVYKVLTRFRRLSDDQFKVFLKCDEIYKTENPSCLLILGDLKRDGVLVPKDEEEALSLYIKAKERFHDEDMKDMVEEKIQLCQQKSWSSTQLSF